MGNNLSGLFTLSVNIMDTVFRLVNHNGLKTFATNFSRLYRLNLVNKRISGHSSKIIVEQIRFCVVESVQTVHLD
jgi:hypothetical protein